MKHRAILFVILGMMFSTRMLATDSSLHGTVTAGPSHVPLSNVRVILREGTREQATLTDVQGNYEFRALDPAVAYTIVAETAGLHPFMQTGIVIGDRGALRVDVNLEMANVHSTVIVTEGLINLDAASAEVSQTIDSTEVEELPASRAPRPSSRFSIRTFFSHLALGRTSPEAAGFRSTEPLTAIRATCWMALQIMTGSMRMARRPSSL